MAIPNLPDVSCIMFVGLIVATRTYRFFGISTDIGSILSKYRNETIFPRFQRIHGNYADFTSFYYTSKLTTPFVSVTGNTSAVSMDE